MSNSMSMKVININGLNKKDELKKIGIVTDWKELDKWINEQEKHFQRNRIESDKIKIEHTIINIDVRHWGKLENYFKYNQRHEPTYEMMKKVLLKKVKKILDPTMSKYDVKVDGFIDKINILNLNLTNLQNWLKKLRSICDGQAKEEYLITKLMARVSEIKKVEVCTNLLKEIKDHIDTYEGRIMNSGQIGKEKKKELNRLKAMQLTVKKFLI